MDGSKGGHAAGQVASDVAMLAVAQLSVDAGVRAHTVIMKINLDVVCSWTLSVVSRYKDFHCVLLSQCSCSYNRAVISAEVEMNPILPMGPLLLSYDRPYTYELFRYLRPGMTSRVHGRTIPRTGVM